MQSVINNFTMLKGIFNFIEKPSLVFVVESVLEMYYSIEGMGYRDGVVIQR
jgi:hypothetical protein